LSPESDGVGPDGFETLLRSSSTDGALAASRQSSFCAERSGEAESHPNPIDIPRAEAAVRELLLALGENPDRIGLEETPQRVAAAYAEMFAGLREDPELELSNQFELNHRELILVKDIELYSICEHHLLPFHGMAHVGYIPGPGGQITGLSKLARVVDIYAKRPTVQERLTTQVADAIVKNLNPSGVIVVVEAEHMCISMRGIKKPGSRTVTSAVRGIFQKNPATRSEAMSLISSSRL